MPDAYNGDTLIHYEISGAGPAALFIPGLGVGIREMKPLADALAEHVTVIALDNRGVGLSDKPNTPYTIESMATDAVAVLDAAGIERASIIGYSMGGRIALHLALKHPDRVDRMVLLATGARITATPQRRLLFAIAPYLKFGPPPRQPAYAFKRQRAASEGYDARRDLPRIQASTLILHGRSDRVASPSFAQELAAGIPDARIEWYEGGHMAPMIRPGPIAEVIGAFLCA